MTAGARRARVCVARAVYLSSTFTFTFAFPVLAPVVVVTGALRCAGLRWFALSLRLAGWLAGRPVGRLVRRPFGCDNRRRLSPNSATRCNAIAPVRHAPGKQGDPDSNRSPGARSCSGCLRRRLQTAHCRLRRPHRSEIRLSLSEGEHRLTHRSRPRSAEAGAETTLSPAPVSELVTRWRSGATY